MLKHRNHELAVVLKNDHRRVRVRCVESEKKKIAGNRARGKRLFKKDQSLV